MAASRFSPRSFCVGGANVNNSWLAITTGVVAFVVLTVTTIVLVCDARQASAARKRTERLGRVTG